MKGKTHATSRFNITFRQKLKRRIARLQRKEDEHHHLVTGAFLNEALNRGGLPSCGKKKY